MKPTMGEQIVYQAVIAGELEIDNQGRIWRVKSRSGLKKGGVKLRNIKRRRAEHDTGTYLQVMVMYNWKKTQCQASRLVYHHFFGPIPDSMRINHKNGKKKDNRPENLELATLSENTLHAVHTLKNHPAANQDGENNHLHKLTDEAVREIRSLRTLIDAEIQTRHGHTISNLAKKYGVEYRTVWKVLRGETWKSVL